MSKEVFNNLVIIVNMLLMFAFVGLAIHTFHSHPDEIIEGAMYTLAAVSFTGGFALSLYKLFKDRLDN